MTSQLPYYYIGKDGKRVLARDLEDDRDRLRDALTQIAAYGDDLANNHLVKCGSYAAFDEPAAVYTARMALEYKP